MKENKKIILITGASSGIGRETALRLAKAGHIVFAGVRKKIDRTELETLNKNIKGFYIDVASESSIEKAFFYVLKHADKIDILINNAGIAYAMPFECQNIKHLKAQFDVNVFGAAAVTQKFMPLLNNARIINISSIASFGLFPYISPYCASKRAMDILMNSFALENKNNIKVVSVKFPAVKTPIWKKSSAAAQAAFNQLGETVQNKYKKEFEYLKQHAAASAVNGIETSEAAAEIIKIINKKNPKSSYDIGLNTCFADFISKLPQGIINRIVKFRLSKIK